MNDHEPAPWTIKRLLEWTVEFFERTLKDVDRTSARLDAEVLLAEAMQCQRITLYTQYDQEPPPEVMDRFRDWVKLRSAGHPVAYLVGHREFYSLSFHVTPDVLIPRPETEHVVMAALELVPQIDARPLRIIDVGTGSGCIAISLIRQVRDTLNIDDLKVAATDVSPEAIAVAERNAADHDVASQLRFFQGDLLDALPAGSGPVHLIVSNPPYVGTSETGTVDPDVARYEPEMALYGGPDGTEIIARLVQQAPDRLLPGGALIFEASPLNIDRCLEIVNSQPGLTDARTESDLAGHRRVVIARRVD